MESLSRNAYSIDDNSDGFLTASVGPLFTSSSAFILASFLIQSTDKHHCPLIYLMFVDASIVPHIVFLKLWVLELISNLINGFQGWSVSQSKDLQYFCNPIFGKNSLSCFQILGPPFDHHFLRTVDGFVGHLLCIIFYISVLDDYPAKQR